MNHYIWGHRVHSRFSATRKMDVPHTDQIVVENHVATTPDGWRFLGCGAELWRHPRYLHAMLAQILQADSPPRMPAELAGLASWLLRPCRGRKPYRVIGKKDQQSQRHFGGGNRLARRHDQALHSNQCVVNFFLPGIFL